jgi:hypothetical protein
LTYAAQEAIWFKELLAEIGFYQPAVEIFEDNQACIKLAKNPQQHSRTKHIQVRYFFQVADSGGRILVWSPHNGNVKVLVGEQLIPARIVNQPVPDILQLRVLLHFGGFKDIRRLSQHGVHVIKGDGKHAGLARQE